MKRLSQRRSRQVRCWLQRLLAGYLSMLAGFEKTLQIGTGGQNGREATRIRVRGSFAFLCQSGQVLGYSLRLPWETRTGFPGPDFRSDNLMPRIG
jgi:hypothetical protein